MEKIKIGLENREDFLKYKEWFKNKYPLLPLVIHPNFVKEYNNERNTRNIN